MMALVVYAPGQIFPGLRLQPPDALHHCTHLVKLGTLPNLHRRLSLANHVPSLCVKYRDNGLGRGMTDSTEPDIVTSLCKWNLQGRRVGSRGHTSRLPCAEYKAVEHAVV